MIARIHRFHGYGSLRYVYQHGQTVRGALLAVRFVENGRRQTYRCAVVVGKKVSKSAVVRNRIRRRLYEIVRQNETDITKPIDIVITVFGVQVATMDALEVQTALQSLLKRAGITRKHELPKPKSSHDIIEAKEP